MATRSRRVKTALAGVLWGTLCLAGCAGHRGPDIPAAPWAQLEMRRGAGEETVLWIDLGGAFKGYKGSTSLRGELSPEQLSDLRELFRDDRIAIYRSDALPTDGSVDLTGTADRPIFRVVVREESPPIRAGSEKMQAYFAEGSGHAVTGEMLSAVREILGGVAEARRGRRGGLRGPVLPPSGGEGTSSWPDSALATYFPTGEHL